MNASATLRPSSSVGDYLKAIWELAGDGSASTKEVAGRLSVSSASVTGMFRRLQEMGLVRYERYRGASLTDAGSSTPFRTSLRSVWRSCWGIRGGIRTGTQSPPPTAPWSSKARSR
ncbi:MAG: metal-dependent transcriptional regulator [Actinobacteria bacterium]|nr:metal-dependent transcriptional regulator [Actinomycetota bacterium]